MQDVHCDVFYRRSRINEVNCIHANNHENGEGKTNRKMSRQHKTMTQE